MILFDALPLVLTVIIQSRVGWGSLDKGEVGCIVLGKSFFGGVGWCGVRGVRCVYNISVH